MGDMTHVERQSISVNAPAIESDEVDCDFLAVKDGTGRSEERHVAQIIGNAFSAGLYVPDVFKDVEEASLNKNEQAESPGLLRMDHGKLAYPRNMEEIVKDGAKDLLYWKNIKNSLLAISMGMLVLVLLERLPLLSFMGYLFLFSVALFRVVRCIAGEGAESAGHRPDEDILSNPCLGYAESEFVDFVILVFERLYGSVIRSLMFRNIRFLLKWMCVLFFFSVICVELPQQWVRLFGWIALFTLPYGLDRFGVSFESVLDETWELCIFGLSFGGVVAFLTGKVLSLVTQCILKKVTNNLS